MHIVNKLDQHSEHMECAAVSIVFALIQYIDTI